MEPVLSVSSFNILFILIDKICISPLLLQLKWIIQDVFNHMQCGHVEEGNGPRQSLLLAKDPDQFSENLIYPKCMCQTHIPKFPETSLNKGKERYNQS